MAKRETVIARHLGQVKDGAVMPKKVGLEDIPDEDLRAELDEIHAWMQMADHRMHVTEQIKLKMGAIRDAIVDELKARKVQA